MLPMSSLLSPKTAELRPVRSILVPYANYFVFENSVCIAILLLLYFFSFCVFSSTILVNKDDHICRQ